MRNRNVVYIIIALLIVAVLLIVMGQRGLLRRTPANTLPLNLQSILPASWALMPEQQKNCDFNHDGREEWLVIYRYDQYSSPAPGSTAAIPLPRGPIGGVVFHTRTSEGTSEPGNPSPYRPELVIPYRLLPDFYGNKGQGYLGEAAVAVTLYSAEPAAKTCQADEIVILGYSDTGKDRFATRFSVFHWVDPTVGYQGQHFVGNARIVPSPAPAAAQRVTTVRTYNWLNERSQLCESRTYQRPDRQDAFDFLEVPQQYTIDFCFGAPNEPFYPEGVVVALLRGDEPDPASSPTGASYLETDSVEPLPPDLAILKDPKRDPIQVVALVHQGTVTPSGDQGQLKPLQDAGQPTKDSWWFGRDTAEVSSDIILNGQQRRVTWTLESAVNAIVSTDIRWRVRKVAMQ